MAEQCIVCLTELEPATDIANVVASPDPGSDENTEVAQKTEPRRTSSGSNDLIACLLPCRHHLHNICLAPWVERANSCPICRQNFNRVELHEQLNGPVVSTYEVESRTQAPHVDPADFPDGFDDDAEYDDNDYLDEFGEEWLHCTSCGSADHGGEMLICHGCERCWHATCADVPNASHGEDWLCAECGSSDAGPLWRESQEVPEPRTRARGLLHVTVGMNRARTYAHEHHRGRHPAISFYDSAWASAWQLAWDRLSLEPDHPRGYDASSSSSSGPLHEPPTNNRHQREFREWQRRFEVAQRQGGNASRFRETKPAFLATLPRAIREEEQAWKDLEKAKDIDRTAPGTRKRKSPGHSPVEPQLDEEEGRRFKRPVRRRAQEMAQLAASGASSSSGRSSMPSQVTGASNVKNAATCLTTTATATTNGNAPSFLRSLLDEVESTGSAEAHEGRATIKMPLATSGEGGASRQASSSPAASPKQAPMGSLSPPATRPGSSTLLSSAVEPVFPAAAGPATSHSPSLSEVSTRRGRARRTNEARSSKSKSSAEDRKDASSPSERSSSPPKREMSPAAKSDLSRLVKLALRPFHRNGEVSNDDYTLINRTVSRKLYDVAGVITDLDPATKERCEKLAAYEVRKAVEGLKSTSVTA